MHNSNMVARTDLAHVFTVVIAAGDSPAFAWTYHLALWTAFFQVSRMLYVR